MSNFSGTTDDIFKYVKKGKVLILDPHDLVAIEMAEQQGNAVFAVSFNNEFVNNVYENDNGRNIYYFDISNIDVLFRDNFFDTVIIDGTLYDLFSREKNARYNKNSSFDSYAGGLAVQTLFNKVYNVMKEDARFIIRGVAKDDNHFEREIIINGEEKFIEYAKDYTTVNPDEPITLYSNGVLRMKVDTYVNLFYSFIYGDTEDAITNVYNFASQNDIRMQLQMFGFKVQYVEMENELLSSYSRRQGMVDCKTEEPIVIKPDYLIVASK